jgi:hypothetical protein
MTDANHVDDPDKTKRYAAYAYMETAFPFDIIFSLCCASLDHPRDGGRIARRRLAMYAPARDNAWVEHLNPKNAKELMLMISGKLATSKNILGRADSLHLGPIRGKPSHLIRNPSAFEQQRGSDFEIWRDFVIDIDLDDYDSDARGTVRYCQCANKKTMCRICWVFVQAAHTFITWRLKRNFGIDDEHVALWVKSGSKGVHCWIGSAEFAGFCPSARTSAFDLLTSMPSIQEDHVDFETLVRIALTPLLDRCMRDVRFRRILKRVLGNEFGMLAGNVPDNVQTAEALYAWASARVSQSWMCDIQAYLMHVFVQPRCDRNVTTSPNHAVKVPFSVNNKTGRVSLPILDWNTSAKPLPLASTVAAKRSMIDAEVAYFKRWIEQYLSDTNSYKI